VQDEWRTRSRAPPRRIRRVGPASAAMRCGHAATATARRPHRHQRRRPTMNRRGRQGVASAGCSPCTRTCRASGGRGVGCHLRASAVAALPARRCDATAQAPAMTSDDGPSRQAGRGVRRPQPMYVHVQGEWRTRSRAAPRRIRRICPAGRGMLAVLLDGLVVLFPARTLSSLDADC
jgi:hypothetical protein